MSGCSVPDSTRSSVVLPAPLRPSTTTRAPRSIASVTSVKISSEPYDLDSSCAVSGVRPHGRRLREAQLGDLVLGPHALGAGQQLLGPLEHALRSLGLGRLGAHLLGLRGERPGGLLGVGPLALAPLLVGLALREVALPADVVLVERGPVGVEVEHLVDHGLEQLDVVADDHQATGVLLQVAPQPGDRVGVEVVGRLVEQQRRRVGEQDAGQLDPAALAAGERPDPLPQHPLGQAQVAADPGSLGLGAVAAEVAEPLLEVAVAPQQVLVVGPLGQLDLHLLQPAQHLVEPARRQHPVAGEDVQVTGPGVLRQVADLPAAHDAAGRGQRLAGERLGERGLAGAVAADQAHPVSRLDTEGDVLQQGARTCAQLDVLHGDHGFLRERRGEGRRAVLRLTASFGSPAESTGPHGWPRVRPTRPARPPRGPHWCQCPVRTPERAPPAGRSARAAPAPPARGEPHVGPRPSRHPGAERTGRHRARRSPGATRARQLGPHPADPAPLAAGRPGRRRCAGPRAGGRRGRTGAGRPRQPDRVRPGGEPGPGADPDLCGPGADGSDPGRRVGAAPERPARDAGRGRAQGAVRPAAGRPRLLLRAAAGRRGTGTRRLPRWAPAAPSSTPSRATSPRPPPGRSTPG